MTIKNIVLEEINGVTCMSLRDAIQLMIRVANNLMGEEDTLIEEWGNEKRLGVVFPDFNIPQSDFSVRIYIDMEGDV